MNTPDTQKNAFEAKTVINVKKNVIIEVNRFFTGTQPIAKVLESYALHKAREKGEQSDRR